MEGGNLISLKLLLTLKEEPKKRSIFLSISEIAMVYKEFFRVVIFDFKPIFSRIFLM